MDEWEVLRAAVGVGRFSPCAKSKRGVVVWDATQGIVATGYNAPPPGFSCDGSEACRAACGKVCVHAEQMAILTAPRLRGLEMLHVKVVDGEGVPSGGPSCPECSKLILASGLAGMWLLEVVDGAPVLVRYSAEEFHRTTLHNCGLPGGEVGGQPG